MTDEQLKKIKQAFTDIGYAIACIGDALAMYADPEPDDEPDPDPTPTPDPAPTPTPDPTPGPTESEFMRKVVLDQGFGGSRFEVPVVVQREPINPFGKSNGGSVDFKYNAPPSMASVMSMRDDVNTVVQFYSRGPTALGVLVGKTRGGWDGFDVVVDDLTNRRAFVAWGFDATTETFLFWVDGVMRGMKQIPGGIGFTPDHVPPLVINSTAGSHQPGTLSPIRLVYAVGACPTQADVDALLGEPAETPGFAQSIDGNEVVVRAIGEGFADKPLVDPLVFADGRVVAVKQVRNNPPRLKEWRGPVPVDVGREVK